MTALPVTTPRTVGNIYAALERTNRTELHPRLSASQLGGECERQIWDSFRWLFPPEHHDGRKLSIFRTGEVWEERIVGMLRDAGMEVDDLDPTTGEQFRIVFAASHASGRTDGKVRGVPEAPKTEHVLEVKTHNDRSFKALLKAGSVQEGKPAHYAQVQLYMHHQHLTRALYVCVNKNDDTLYSERIEYDATAAIKLVAKAERLATQDRRPECTCPSYFLKAGYGCAVNEGLFPARNCRTCMFVTFRLDGDARVECERHKRDVCVDEQRVIAQCRPDVVVGEQVASKDGLSWLDLVHADLEGTGYAVGAADTCAAGFGAPHIRQRLWWVGTRLAEPHDTLGRAIAPGRDDDRGPDAGRTQGAGHAEAGRGLCGLADADRERHVGIDTLLRSQNDGWIGAEAVHEAAGRRIRNNLGLDPADPTHHHSQLLAASAAQTGRMDDRDGAGKGQAQPGVHGLAGGAVPDGSAIRTGPTNGFWSSPDWLQCRDGKWRAVESSTFPLVDGSAERMVRGRDPSEPFDAQRSAEARVARLRGYGNAIVSAAAEGFIASVMEALSDPAPTRTEQLAGHVRAYEDEIGVWE